VGASVLHILLFLMIPGLALALKLGWHNSAGLLLVWALALGVVLLPIALLPFWIAGWESGPLLIPIIGAIFLFQYREKLKLSFCYAPLYSVFSYSKGVIFSIFILITIFLCVVDPFSIVPLEDLLVHQGVLMRAVQAGFPPENPLVEGVNLSYNYAAHLMMAHFTKLWGIAPVASVGRIFPILLLSALLLSTFAFAVEVLRIPMWAALIAMISAFWVVGYGPLNMQLYGALLAPPNIRLIGPLGALVTFLVAVRLISATGTIDGARGTGRALLFGALVFSATGYRAPVGPILICSALFVGFLPVLRTERPNIGAIVMAFCGLVGFTGAGFIFLTFGSNISGTSFASINTTFYWLSERDNIYPLANLLKSFGFTELLVGIVTFLVMAIMQAGFLVPAFIAQIFEFRHKQPSTAVLALIGASIAGICGTMLTSAPGGSHFSFINLANLSMSLLGGCGLVVLIRCVSSPVRRTRLWARLAIFGCVALSALSVWEITYQLDRFGSARIANLFVRPHVERVEELEPLLGMLESSDLTLFLGNDDHELNDLAMNYNLNLVANLHALTMYSTWESPISAVFSRRVEVVQRLRSDAASGMVREEVLHLLSETLVDRDRSYFVIAPTSANADEVSSLLLIDQTSSYSLYRWSPR